MKVVVLVLFVGVLNTGIVTFNQLKNYNAGLPSKHTLKQDSLVIITLFQVVFVM